MKLLLRPYLKNPLASQTLPLKFVGIANCQIISLLLIRIGYFTTRTLPCAAPGDLCLWNNVFIMSFVD